MNHDVKKLGIYIHIPFCVRKCNYCDFLSFPAEESVKDAYVSILCSQISSGVPDDASVEVSSIFLGGGTPSVLRAEQLNAVLETAFSTFPVSDRAEISVECNPGTLTPEKLKALKAAGVNRLSLGLQSADPAQLRLLGRIHTWETFLETWDLAQKAGFTNINVDLMSALPGQTVSSWEETLRRVLSLCPRHISAYSLIIEEGTAFYETYHEADEARLRGAVQSLLPSEEEERAMYDLTQHMLGEAGLRRYEISNYAVPGFESIHNCGYWTRRNYLGFGLGAASLFNNTRWKNTDDLNEYLSCSDGDFTRCRKEIAQLSVKEQIEETMFLGLRMMKGVNLDEFARQFGQRAQDLYAQVIAKGKTQGLLCEEEGCLRLTKHGIDVSNVVLSWCLRD